VQLADLPQAAAGEHRGLEPCRPLDRLDRFACCVDDLERRLRDVVDLE
jgi:hypothetical protein